MPNWTHSHAINYSNFCKKLDFMHMLPSCIVKETKLWFNQIHQISYRNNVGLAACVTQYCVATFYLTAVEPLCARQYSGESMSLSWELKSYDSTSRIIPMMQLRLETYISRPSHISKLSPSLRCKWWSWPYTETILLTSALSLDLQEDDFHSSVLRWLVPALSSEWVSELLTLRLLAWSPGAAVLTSLPVSLEQSSTGKKASPGTASQSAHSITRLSWQNAFLLTCNFNYRRCAYTCGLCTQEIYGLIPGFWFSSWDWGLN